MAKKKKQKASCQSQKPISLERYIKENARKLPLGKCYINKNWQPNGLAHILITRPRPNGEFVIADFIVDTFCLGVKDAFYAIKWDLSDIVDYLAKWPSYDEISYEEVHNIIYGAISFAEDAGIDPHKDFSIAQYVLEEDTDDIPLIDYEFGREGKYFLVIGEDGKERIYINTLAERLGDDFDYLMPIDDDDYDDDGNVVGKAATTAIMKSVLNKMSNPNKQPYEDYSYQHPAYPKTLNVKHQFIADAFADRQNFYRLPVDIIDRILSLPVEEAVSDINNILMYEIGRTYKAIDNLTAEEDENGSIMHSLIMLSALKSPEGLNAVLEIMRQNGNFADFHLGDLAPEIISQALYASCKDNLKPMLEYMYTPGFESYLRCNCLDTLAMIALNQPERRGEIIEIFRELLISMVDRLPRLEGCDGEFAGFVMSALLDLNASELMPEINDVYATGCVEDDITGDLEYIINNINTDQSIHLYRYKQLTTDELYSKLK